MVLSPSLSLNKIVIVYPFIYIYIVFEKIVYPFIYIYIYILLPFVQRLCGSSYGALEIIRAYYLILLGGKTFDPLGMFCAGKLCDFLSIVTNTVKFCLWQF